MNLSFWYYMYGATIGSLNLDVYHDGGWENNVYSLTGQQQTTGTDSYYEAVVDLSSYTGQIQLRLRGVRGTSYTGDIAIDDINITYVPRVAGGASAGNFTIYALNTTEDITAIQNITWTTSGTDATNNITIQVSVDNGATWYDATNNLGLSGFTQNSSLVYRALFTTDSSTTISLDQINITWVPVFVDNPPTVNLSYPAASYTNSTHQYVNLTFNASATDDWNIKNCSLWTNYTGTWALNQSQTVTGTANVTAFNLTNLNNKVFIWNIECYDNASNASWGSANRTVILNWTAPAGVEMEFVTIEWIEPEVEMSFEELPPVMTIDQQKTDEITFVESLADTIWTMFT
jgi:hypothetical protein